MHRPAHGGLAAGLLAAALVLQATVLSWLALPTASPDLVLLVLVALALRDGPELGLIAGFAAGFALDVLPPADHAVGRWALVLCLIGYACGFLEEEADRSALLPIIVAAVAAAASVLGFAGLGVLIDDPRVRLDAVLRILPAVVAYDVLLSPFVIYTVFRLHRRAASGQVLSRRGH